MAKITFVLGGARSGKSRFAEDLAKQSAGQLVYVATAQALDTEMADRIARHQSDRGSQWQTVECPVDLSKAVSVNAGVDRVVLIDCLTLWLTNIMLGDHDIEQAVSQLLLSLQASAAHIILVSNEVGQGIVPDNALARRFRDEAGRLHQQMARIAGTVWFVTAGLPQKLK